MHEEENSNIIEEENDEKVAEKITLTGENELPSTSDHRDEEVEELVTALKNTPIDDGDKEACWQTTEWKSQKKHIFILSSAGKPIYSRYGNEDDLVTLFGVTQAIVSVVLDSDDEIQSIHTFNTHFTFLHRGNLLLVSVSQTPTDTEITSRQLIYVYNQVVSILTLSQLTRIFEQYNNFDLRRLLNGSERLINNIIEFTENEPGFFLNGVECLPLSPSVRDSIAQAVTSSCQKIKNLLFAILITNNQLVILVRMKKYNLLPGDMHLIFNLINSSQSFKSVEGWTPICLPNFDPSGYLQAHVSYLSEDCQACLMMLTIDRESFFILSEAKQKIVEKLRKNNTMELLVEALKEPRISPVEFGVPKLRHFIYKNKTTSQYVFPTFEVPYQQPEQQAALLYLYSQIHQQVNMPNRRLKLIFQQLKTEVVLGWDTKGFELYLIFEPFITKQEAIVAVNKLLKNMKKEEERLIINSSPTF